MRSLITEEEVKNMERMRFKEIQAIYPEAMLLKKGPFSSETINVPILDGYACFLREDLTEREVLLFSRLNQSQSINKKRHPWYEILFENKQNTEDGEYRIIQVYMKHLEDSQKESILKEIREIFPNSVDLFFYQQFLLIVEKRGLDNLFVNDLEGIFLALDMDFDFSTRLFLGSFHVWKHDFSQLFREEKKAFIDSLKKNFNVKCLELSDCIISVFSNQIASESGLLLSLYQDWFDDEEMRRLIRVLWEQQGNFSSAAKELFMHRNSLLYKIDKFQERTMLNLKNNNSLFLCYLLVSLFS